MVDEKLIWIKTLDRRSIFVFGLVLGFVAGIVAWSWFIAHVGP
jgi:hypothetical protein